MNRHKDMFFRLITPVSKILGERTLKSLLKDQILLPLYHAVCDKEPAHLKNLYSIRSTGEFEKDLDYLLKIARPVTLNEIIKYTRETIKIDTPVFHITFDDGLREFYNYAAPLLSSRGISATCLLNSSFIDNREIFYRFKSSLLIEKLHDASRGSPEWKKYHQWIHKNKIALADYRTVLLSIHYNNSYLLDELAEEIELDFTEYLNREKPYLTTEQIKDLINEGFTFGAHSMDHPDYQTLSEDEQLDQTRVSCDLISQGFKLDYRVFSFPFTDHLIHKSFFEKIAKEEIAVLTFGCAGMKEDSIKSNLQRIPVEIYHGTMDSLLKKEALYHLVLTMIRKDVIIRN